jgi:dihydroorotase
VVVVVVVVADEGDVLTRISGGRVIDPARGLDEVRDLWFEDGRVVESPGTAPDEVIDASGLWVVPGLIDLHVHLREPGGEHKEDIGSGTTAAAAGGFTAVCAMPNTSPADDDPAVLELILRRAAEVGRCRVWPVAAVTRARAGRELTDFEALLAAGAVAFSDDGSPVATADILRRALIRAGELGALIMDHPEEIALTRSGVAHDGDVAARLGLAGMPAVAEELCVARDVLLAEHLGVRIHLQHISTAGAVRLVADAKARGVRVTAEVTPHHLVGTDELLEVDPALAKVNPPLRTARDRDALRQGLADGTIDAIATDHAPHSAEEKARSPAEAPFGISGLEAALPLCMELVETGLITPLRLIDALSTAPARVLGKRGHGSLAHGVEADMTIIDPRHVHRIDPARWLSRGRNTPFASRVVRGRVVRTFVRGEPSFP